MSNYIYRRCVCQNCGNRFTTYEARSDYEFFVNTKVNAKLLEKIDELEQSLAFLRKIVEESLEDVHVSLR